MGEQRIIFLWNPEDGSSKQIQEGESFFIEGYRAVFLMRSKK